MSYRKLNADAIFNGYELLTGKVLVMNNDGSVASVINKQDAGEDIINYEGILAPGFINSHCHLELSYLKDYIEPHKGLVDFLLSVIKLRTKLEVEKEEPMLAAVQEMKNSGIIAIGDISNTVDALQIKYNSSLDWYNFIEVINYRNDNLQNVISNSNNIVGQHKFLGFEAVLSPHAPYTVSDETYKIINKATKRKTITIHNQESPEEDKLFLSGNSGFLEIYKQFGDGSSPIPVSGKTSLQSWLPFFRNEQTILSVHNTYISEDDILFAKAYEKEYDVRIVYCLCPNANLYIESALPPIDLLIKHDCHIVLGTDSYSSNWQLDIAAEMKAILDRVPGIRIEQLLKWATSNAAKAFDFRDYGSFENGKRPGVVLLNKETLSSRKIM